MNNKSHLLQIEKKHFLYITLILYFIFFHKITHSQTTFNEEIWPMKFISVSGPILTKGDTIICLGHGTDYWAYSYYVAYIAKYDIQGDFINRNVDSLGNPSYQNITDAYWDKNKIITYVNNITFEFNGGYFLIIDSNTGEYVKKIKIYFKNDPDRAVAAEGLCKIDSIHYAALSSSPYDGYYSNVNIIVSIVNIKTGKVKNIEIKKDSTYDIPEFIKWTGKKLLVSALSDVTYWDTELQKYISDYTVSMFEIDTSGTWKEAYSTKDTTEANIKKLLINKDKEYICTSFRIKYHTYENERKFRWHFNVFKLDSNYNRIWEKPWGMDYDFNYYFGQAGILEAEDKDGYILCGYQPNFPYTKQGYGVWNLSQETVDSMKEAGTIPMTIGVLQKINEDGDSIWLRTYSYVNDTSLNFVDHRLKSIIHSPDGGYIMYGHILHTPRPGIDTANQYPGWLLKVDKYGCLIPGCQDTTDTTSAVDIITDIDIMLYPNPASDKLYIYQSNSGDTHYTITDISGRTIQKWSGNLPNHTYILDVGRYKPGVYILAVDREGERRAEKFVVER